MFHKKVNLLDLRFEKNPSVFFEKNDAQNVGLHVPLRGFMYGFLRKLLKKPEVCRVDLDKLGSFVWLAMDEFDNIKELSDALEKSFPEESDMALQRVAAFVQILETNSLVFRKKA